MLAQLAWKNIWRNKKRSLVIITAIALGLSGGLFSGALMMGMGESMVNSAIDRHIGHIQIHTKQFSNDPHISFYIRGIDNIRNTINSQDSITAFSERTIIDGMAQSAASSFGVKIIGVNPADEIRVTKLSDNIIDGTFLESTSKNQIAIGQKLADRLNLGMRKKVILTYQNTKGDIVYLACRISGIFKTESSFFDETTVFLKQEDLTRSLNQSQIIMNESVNTSEEKQNDVLIHEIAFRVASSKDVDTVKKNLAQLFPQLDVQSWEELAPELAYISSSMILFTYLFVGIILFALLFGITNNMLMSVMERIRELGILTAVGMKKLRIFIMILLETILLSLTGGFAGMLLGAFFIEFYNKKGIDLSAFASSLEAFGSGTMLYPFLPLSMYLVLTAMIILAANIASLFPAWKATHLLPAEAIRTY